MMKRSFKKKRQAPSADVALNITAMADIFTILLVFLLKSFTSGGLTLNPSSGLLLPKAKAERGNIEALKVEISKTAVLVEGQVAVTLKDYSFEKSDLKNNGTSALLGAALKKERERQVLIAKNNTDVKIDPKVIVVADQGTPYESIKTVLASAAVHGYTDFKLAVITE